MKAILAWFCFVLFLFLWFISEFPRTKSNIVYDDNRILDTLTTQEQQINRDFGELLRKNQNDRIRPRSF